MAGPALPPFTIIPDEVYNASSSKLWRKVGKTPGRSEQWLDVFANKPVGKWSENAMATFASYSKAEHEDMMQNHCPLAVDPPPMAPAPVKDDFEAFLMTMDEPEQLLAYFADWQETAAEAHDCEAFLMTMDEPEQLLASFADWQARKKKALKLPKAPVTKKPAAKKPATKSVRIDDVITEFDAKSRSLSGKVVGMGDTHVFVMTASSKERKLVSKQTISKVEPTIKKKKEGKQVVAKMPLPPIGSKVDFQTQPGNKLVGTVTHREGDILRLSCGPAALPWHVNIKRCQVLRIHEEKTITNADLFGSGSE
jgi:hypothetical protein